jgi:hypothetical protein
MMEQSMKSPPPLVVHAHHQTHDQSHHQICPHRDHHPPF